MLHFWVAYGGSEFYTSSNTLSLAHLCSCCERVTVKWHLTVVLTCIPRWLQSVPWRLSGKESACNAGDAKTRAWSLNQKIPWRREWPSAPVFLPGESHGQRSLVGYSPWGCKRIRRGTATQLQIGTMFHVVLASIYLLSWNLSSNLLFNWIKQFLLFLPAFVLLRFGGPLHILDKTPLLDIWFANTSDWLLYFLNKVFWSAKVLIW